MFCKKCGAHIDDTIKFCPVCGTAVQKENVPVSATQKIRGSILKHKASYTVILIAVIALFFLLHSCSSGNSYDSPIKTILTAMEEKNFSKVLDAFPDEIIDKLTEESGMDIKMMADAMGESMFDSLSENGESYSLDYQINSEQNLTLSEIEELHDKILRRTKVDLDISEAKELKVTLVKEVAGDKDYDDDTIIVIKIGRKWYMNPLELS